MTHPPRICAALLIAGLVPSCFITSVGDATTGAPLQGALVEVQNCSTCTTYTRSTGHDTRYPGVVYWDAYANDNPVTAEAGSGVRVKVSKPGYQTRELFIWPKYMTDASGKQFAANEVLLYPVGPDSDRDGLLDAHEQRIGTNPFARDTDGDGISDRAEVDGFGWVDYKALGANPLRRDVFIELDYEEYTEQGVKHSARPTELAITRLQEVYAALPIINPDGSRGVAIHVLLDDRLPRGTDCGTYQTTDRFDAIHRAGFRYGMFCLGGGGGQGELGGQRFRGSIQHNPDPADDATETSHFKQFVTIAHELGHNLGLNHGGNEGINCKPNYPSLMNYRYAYHFNGAGGRLADSRVQFSTGRFLNYPLDENNLRETASFPGLAPQDLTFLADSFRVSGTSVDWNRNGVFETTPIAANITADCDNDAFLQVLRDHNDAPTILENVGTRIPGVDLGQSRLISGSPITCTFPAP